MTLGVINGATRRDHRRLGRSDPFQLHHHQGHGFDRAGRFFRPLHPLRRARIRHGGGDERHLAAWRLRALWRHVSGVFRLRPRRDKARRLDGRARGLCAHPRLRSALARTGRRISRSSISPACAPCRTSTSSAPPTRSRPPNAGSWRSPRETTPSVLSLSRQNLPTLERPVAENLSARGAYVLREPGGGRDVTLLATGSEVAIALEAAKLLEAQGQARGGRLHAELRAVRGAAGRLIAPWCWERRRASASRPPCALAGTAGLARKAPSSA